MDGNGTNTHQQLTLTRDRATGVVSLTCNVQMSLDDMLNILVQAHRHLEVKFRIAAAIDAQDEMAQAKADRELANKLKL